MRAALAGGAVLVLSAAAASDTGGGQADPAAAGARGYRQYCQSCHALGPGPAARTGPALDGVAGRMAGAVPGYAYSEALKTSGIVWDEAAFVAFLRAPAQRVPGTKKVTVGALSEQTLATIYRYLAAQRPMGGG